MSLTSGANIEFISFYSILEAYWNDDEKSFDVFVKVGVESNPQ